jgi:hypothetical protein
MAYYIKINVNEKESSYKIENESLVNQAYKPFRKGIKKDK